MSGKIIQYGGKLLGNLVLECVVSNVRLLLGLDCPYTYRVEQFPLGGDEGTGSTYIRLLSDKDMDVNQNTLEGHPSECNIICLPGSRIRDMFLSRYGVNANINVKEFWEWFKPILEFKIRNEKLDIELQVESENFEKVSRFYSEKVQITRETLKKTKWFITLRE